MCDSEFLDKDFWMELLLFILSVITVKTLSSLSLCNKEKEQCFLQIFSILCIVTHAEPYLWEQETRVRKVIRRAPRIGGTLRYELKYCCWFMR